MNYNEGEVELNVKERIKLPSQKLFLIKYIGDRSFR